MGKKKKQNQVKGARSAVGGQEERREAGGVVSLDRMLGQH